MEERIKSQIRSEIERRLVGTNLKYSNLEKKLINIFSWWNNGFKFKEPFDLADIPVNGPREVTVEFTFWGDLDWGEGNRKRHTISGNFGPIVIHFNEGTYHLDFSKSNFPPLEIS